MLKKALFLGLIFSIILLFLYSFTQVDLGLTLLRLSIWQTLQKYFQAIGYFNRPLSTGLYLGILILLFSFYIGFLALTAKNKITRKEFWILIIIVSSVLLFSYNAFSYDLFNYIFDAKIITAYGQNPYMHKALDYPNDPMLSFMHWTHRTFPYGPFWLALSIPLSLLGFKLFLLTFFLFKALAVAFFLGTVFYIEKIVNKFLPKDSLFAAAVFALNPLIIIESLVSAHNDIVMIFFSMSAIYLFIDNKYTRSLILFVLSITVKFATIFLIPIYILVYVFQKRRKKISLQLVSLISILLMIIPIVAASQRTNFQPWYLMFIIPFAALIGKNYYILIPTVIISFFALLQYAPFLYLGNWNNPVPTINYWILVIAISLSLFADSVLFFKFKLYSKNDRIKNI